MTKSTILPLATLSALALSTAVHAGPPSVPPTAPSPEKEESIYDKLWSIPVLYKNKDNAFIQEFRFTGRLQGEVYTQDSDLGAEQDWVVRRTRFGFKAKLLQDFTVHAEMDLNPQDPNPLYSKLTDAYIAWSPDKAFTLKVGKQSAEFTLDGHTSSKELITIDRSNLSNNFWFPTEYISGVTVSGEANQWQWNVGYFSGGTETPEFGNFDAGEFILGSIGYDFGKQLGIDQALVMVDYVHNERNVESNATRRFENIGSLSIQLENGRWALAADLTAGSGFGGQSDAFGFLVMPSYKITDKLQAVARYTHIQSDDPDGVRFSRYESVATGGRGDEYNEYYVGLNYYFYGHKLKVQSGLTYADMEDSSANGGEYHGWTWTTGLRVSF
jgi:phosphate-selective porin OprO and OprP